MNDLLRITILPLISKLIKRVNYNQVKEYDSQATDRIEILMLHQLLQQINYFKEGITQNYRYLYY